VPRWRIICGIRLWDGQSLDWSTPVRFFQRVRDVAVDRASYSVRRSNQF
jgi:hypothetical protein